MRNLTTLGELDVDDRQKILEFLQSFKRGKRYYNLNKTQKKELERLIEKLKAL